MKDESEKTKEKKETTESINYFKLFRYSTKLDIFLMILALFCAAAKGAAQPMFAVLFGFVIDEINNIQNINTICIAFVIVGVVAFALSSVYTAIFIYVSEKQTIKCRIEYVSSVLKQEIGWFEENKASVLSSYLARDMDNFHKAISEKLPNLVEFICTFLIGIILAFYFGWHMALVVLAGVPFLAGTVALLAFCNKKIESESKLAYNKARLVTSNAIRGIQTVVSFNRQEYELKNYDECLLPVKSNGVKKSVISSSLIGLMICIMLILYGVALYYGAYIVNNVVTPYTGKFYTGGDVMKIFFLLIIGSFTLGQIGPIINTISEGCCSAAKIFEIIDRKSNIDYSCEDGIILDKYNGNLIFQNAKFAYPSRKEVNVFNDLSFSIKSAEKVAFVGPSGVGKSTIVALLERWYDLDSGEIGVPKINLLDVNLRCWRQQIGLVMQEPVLLSGSIADNIRMGKENATEEEIKNAAELANARKFIENLEGKYDTEVGGQNSLLSGGQKQRIAIARALIKDPKLLILDEATSALDNKSEESVQKAIQRAMVGRTTIIIAHRLSTIKNSDRIILLSEGKIMEEGTHSDLMALNKGYANLVKIQQNLREEANAKKISKEIIKERSQSFYSISKSNRKDQINIKNKQNITIAKKEENFEKKEKKNFSKKFKKQVKSILDLLKLSRSDWHFIFLGCAFSTIVGLVIPIWAIFTSKLIALFVIQDTQQRLKEALNFSLIIIGIGIADLIGFIGTGYFFGLASENLVKKIRHKAFQSILDKKIEWFDFLENDCNVLVGKLEKDSALISGIGVGQIPLIVQATVTLISGITISLVNSWKLGLVVLSTVPLLAFASIVEMRVFSGFDRESATSYNEVDQLCSEAFENIRTVSSFCYEDKILNKYKKALQKPYKTAKKKAIFAAIPYGFSQGIFFFVSALAFWYGGLLISNGEATFEKVLIAIFAAMFGVGGIGNTIAFAPDIQKANKAKTNIFNLINSTELNEKVGGKKVENNEINISIENAFFRYPMRPDDLVFNGLNFNVKHGETISIVGESGSGKSSIISLILGFYKIEKGAILINNEPIENFDIKDIRDKIGLVQQEPILFDTTIAENIRYGKLDATEDEIVIAAKAANIHNVIIEMPDKYETICGEGGSQLSGGQKQRVAIARAILKNPKIFMFDEATSALDSESEKVVQNAIYDLMEDKKGKRTILTISHRLSTVKFSEKIVVIAEKKNQEEGSHEMLINKKGVYYHLVQSSLG